MPNVPWFKVNKAGLAEIARRGKWYQTVIAELVQNAWDEATTVCTLSLTPVDGSPSVDVEVVDDNPDGWIRIDDSYTLFRRSLKEDATKRGRFNMGEKLILANASEAKLTTTTGTILFGKNGRRNSKERTEVGSTLTARIRMTRTELEKAISFSGLLIPPPAVKTIINGTELLPRTPIESDNVSLPTEICKEDNSFSPTVRKTIVNVYEVREGEKPHLYELGIPVDTIDCDWHVEVMQRVPLGTERQSAKASYVRKVLVHVVNMMAHRMTKDQARKGYVEQALPNLESDQAVKDVLNKKHGRLRVTYDPSDPEANTAARLKGYTVVSGGSHTGSSWDRIKSIEGALPPAGEEFQSYATWEEKGGFFDPDQPDKFPPVPRDKWTEGMVSVATYTEALHLFLVGCRVSVEYIKPGAVSPRGTVGCYMACYGHGQLTFNLSKGVRAIIDSQDQNELDALLIHEFAHATAKDHYTPDFYNECCRLGAQIRDYPDRVWNNPN